MNVLILGSGGREHTFAWKISQSPLCDALYIAPGNAGTMQHGTNIPIDIMNFSEIQRVVEEHAIHMVIVGPEAPLVAGIYDYFQQEPSLQKIPVIGPSKAGAQLEGSKAFSKAFMGKYNIPTAGYREFTQNNLREGFEYIDTITPPVVLKADGLAAGKGVLIINDPEEAKAELAAMLEGKFWSASQKVVIEDFLDGIEFSVFALTDGESYKILPVAKDYKRIGEGDTGLNTGGMGAVSPVPFVNASLMKKVEEHIIKPTIQGIAREELVYNGFVFFGLIMVKEDPYVIEYNCRMGDPETEVVLPRLENDLLEMLVQLTEGSLGDVEVKISPEAATTIMLVSGGYPEAYEKGKEMTGLEAVTNSLLFHAGTRKSGGQVLTNGGRVLAITSMDNNFKNALKTSNQNAEVINFAGKNYRTDIGFDL